MLAEEIVRREGGSHQGRESEQADTDNFSPEFHGDSLDAENPNWTGAPGACPEHPFRKGRGRALIQVKADGALLRQALRYWVAVGDARDQGRKAGAKPLRQAGCMPRRIGVWQGGRGSLPGGRTRAPAEAGALRQPGGAGGRTAVAS